MARTTLEVLVLVLAGFALIASLIGRRLNPSPEGKRSSLAGILVSLAIIIGVAPGFFLPKVVWVRGPASALSIALSLATIVIVIQSSRRSSRSEPSSRPDMS
jgi:4-amino-4-deoxy-L-arabinose transferase-like glycosyltransferase